MAFISTLTRGKSSFIVILMDLISFYFPTSSSAFIAEIRYLKDKCLDGHM